MKLLMLTPGTGSFFCGSCLRDQSLAQALRREGHDVTVVPLYLPPFLEEDDEQTRIEPRVAMGGINMWLQQKTRIARLLPRPIRDLLDRPSLLRRVSRRSGMTCGDGLSAMTLSMVRGDEGRQRAMLDQLTAKLATRARPDAIVLSNIMLAGMVRRLKQALGRPVVVTLQGESPFLDTLSPDFAERIWNVLRERAAEIDAFVPVSRHYGALMRDRLELEPARVHPVHNGIDLEDFPFTTAGLAQRQPMTLGFLARMCRDKGLDTLVDAFVRLRERGRVQALRLHVAGALLPEDRPFVHELQETLRAKGLEREVTFSPNVTRRDKIAMLGSLFALSVPARYEESFGLYLLEAMAAGVPVVQPRHAAFPEVLEETGGGVLCEPGPEPLACALESLLLDLPRAQALADRGRTAVTRRFTAARMAREVAAICSATVATAPTHHAPE